MRRFCPATPGQYGVRIQFHTGIYPPHHTAAFRSDDAGKSWQATFFPDQRFKNLNVAHDYMTVPCGQFFQAVPYGTAIAQNNPDICLQVDAGRCFITTDGGKKLGQRSHYARARSRAAG